jgi:catechol 2,3-dioxygenase-like lactoylglutathione lyase family enzyme
VIIGSHFIFFSKDADADRRFFQEVFGFRAADAGGWLIFDAGWVEKTYRAPSAWRRALPDVRQSF